jgi:hypothetical protein
MVPSSRDSCVHRSRSIRPLTAQPQAANESLIAVQFRRPIYTRRMLKSRDLFGLGIDPISRRRNHDLESVRTRESPTRSPGPTGTRSACSADGERSSSVNASARAEVGATEGFGYLLKDRVLEIDDFLDAVSRVGKGGTAIQHLALARCELCARRPSRRTSTRSSGNSAFFCRRRTSTAACWRCSRTCVRNR